MVRLTVFIAALLSLMQLASPKLASQSRASEGGRQTQEDDDTRYELLAPDTAQFRIYYEVTGTTAGARFFFNTIRPGSIATDERVIAWIAAR